MAYYNQEMKKKVAPKIKAILKKYDMKGTLSVRNYSEVVLTLSEGPIDFNINGRVNIDVNVYWIDTNYNGIAKTFLNEVYACLMEGNYNNSDVMTDYFDRGWYVSIQVGRWDKPYKLKETSC